MVDLIENDSEIILEKMEEEQMVEGTDESDDEGNGLFDLNFSDQKNKKITNKEYKVDSLTDSENWRLELERVLPQLKVVVKTDPRDWRAHLEQMRSLRSNIESATEETDSQLKKLQTDISYVMEKIESREKHLNNDLKELVQQYKEILVEYNQVNNQIKRSDSEKMEKEHELSKITNELENIKIQMEQRGNSMTDGSKICLPYLLKVLYFNEQMYLLGPLINIKKAIFRIKEEISDMDIKIGVMEHTLNSEIIKQSAQYAEFDSLVMAAH